MDIEGLLQFDKRHIWHPYTSMKDPLPVYLVKEAKGVRIRLYDNRELIDGMASWWAVIHGYNHPVLNQAIKTQLGKMAHVMFGGLTHEPAIRLAKKLIEITPNGLDTVFFADNSLDAWTWEWYFGDPLSGNNYSTEQNPWHFYSSNGSYSVSLVITNAYGCTDSITKHDFILVGIDTSSSLGIGENNIISSFLLYPNPSTNNINILLNLAKSGFVEIRLLSITGQEVLKRNFETIIPGTTEVQMEIASLGLSKGLYLIELNYKGNYFYKKIAINSQ